MPRELFDILLKLSMDRTGKLRPSRNNSFEALDSMAKEVETYAASLPPMSDYKEDASAAEED